MILGSKTGTFIYLPGTNFKTADNKGKFNHFTRKNSMSLEITYLHHMHQL